MADHRRAMPHARASCQAAALYQHWMRGDESMDGELEVLAELDDPAEWVALVCAMLNLGTNLTKAAGDGKADEYLAYAAREAMLDEAMQDDR